MSTRTRRTAALLGGLLLSAAALAGCGDDDVSTSTGDAIEETEGEASDDVVDPGAAAGTCPEGTVDCVDTPTDGGPSAGMCLEGATDCEDTVMDPDDSVSSPADGGGSAGSPGADDEYPSEAARERARAQLGRAEGELEDDIRVGRRGDEQMMLTEDYVLGRITVELDDDGTGTFVVTQATVELPDGPETFTLDTD